MKASTIKNQKTIVKFNSDAKAKELQAEIEKDKAERLTKFVDAFQKLEKEFNCKLIPRTIIQEGKIFEQLVPIAN